MNVAARHQAALSELSRVALAGAELSTLRNQAVTLVAATLAVEYSGIWDLRADAAVMVLRAGTGWPAGALGQATMCVAPAGATTAPWPDSVPLLVTDWDSETRVLQPPLLRDHGVRAGIWVAIPGPAGPCGLLSADSVRCRKFTSPDISFLHAVAHMLALARERVQIQEALDGPVGARTHEIEQQLIAAAQDRAVLEERQRLARDLHDSVIQALYSVALHAEAANRLLAAGDVGTAGEYLCDLRDTAQEALEEMRLLIFELRPPVLEQVGLAAALQARLGAVERRANLQTELIVEGVGDLPARVEQALYRIAQEALTNALKHARARCIMVRLRQIESQVILEITDDGIGFDPATGGAQGGLGLQGIAERVTRLDGRLTMQSRPGAGTRLRVEVAL
jgi:signal transduction histidine kinase